MSHEDTLLIVAAIWGIAHAVWGVAAVLVAGILARAWR
jgi:hypothetical protein